MQKRLIINGTTREINCPDDRRLLDVLREDFGLTGAKRGCDNSGECGACSVIMDGRVVRSCLVKIEEVKEGASLTTVEGIGTIEDPHPIQKAFAWEGAIQCGYCTPGMVVVAKALLDRNTSPTEEEIRQAFRNNLCRCTGYVSIIRAVQLAGRLVRGVVREDEVKVDTSHGTFGKRVPRPDSLAKATGTTRFGDDIPVPEGTLHLKMARSPHHHAIIRSLDTSVATNMPGVAGVFTAADIPGDRSLDIFCEKKVVGWGAAVALVAAETVEQAGSAAERVVVDYEVLPAYPTPRESLAEDAMPISPLHSNNVACAGTLKKGVKDRQELERELAASAVTVSAGFVTSRQAHLTLEPDNSLAYVDSDGRLTVMSKPSAIHKFAGELAGMLGITPKMVRCIENPSGGSFGYKDNITSEGFVALAAHKLHRPCKIVYSMAETILTTGKRVRVWANATAGATRDGRITALLYDFKQDCGGAERRGRSLLAKGHRYIGGPHRIPKIYGEGSSVLTNSNLGVSCIRGLGTTPIEFVSEVLLDMLAEKAGLDPLEFRLRNAWRNDGDLPNWGQPVDCYPYPAMLDKLRPLYLAAVEEARKASTPAEGRGVGIAAGLFGCGIDHIQDTARAWVELNPDDGITVYAAWTDSGGGGDIGMTTVASRAMGGLPPEKIRIVSRDSSLTPPAGPGVASRQTALVGNAIRLACEALVKTMRDNGCRGYRDMAARGLPLRHEGVQVTSTVTPIDDNFQGLPTENWSYSLQMAEVEVEVATGRVKLLKITSVLDAGVIHNPISVEGQCEGGAVMGAGFGLWEDFEPGNTDSLIRAGMPTFLNSPPVECHFLETYRARGNYGGVGCGEVVMMPTAPAIANAIHDACGIRVTELPATPRRVLHLLRRHER